MADQKTNTMMMRAATFVPSSINEEQRTVDVVFTTDTPVPMSTWRLGNFIETLSHEKGHVRTKRLDAGVPILDNHNQWGGTRGVLGVLENYRIEKGKGTGTMRFSKRGDDYVEGVWQDVKDGILRGISAGYRVYKYEDTNPTRKEDEIPEYRAIDWEVFEVSIAPIQADINSAIRNENAEENEVEILTTRSTTTQNPEKQNIMADETKPNAGAEDIQRGVPPATPPAAPAVDTEQVRKEAVEAERKRSAEIVESVRKMGLGEEFATKLVNDGTAIEEARKLIIEEFAKQDPNNGQNNIRMGVDETDKRREVQTAALVMRATPDIAKDFQPELVAAAREYRGLTLMDMARQSLERAGVKTTGMDKMELVGRAITQSGSDFPVLLEGTNRRILLAAYTAAGDVWRRFCTTGSVGDFREYKRLSMGSFGNLDAVGENREFKNKNIPDAAYEKNKASTKGNIINVSREMIINDDLGAFTRLAAMLGRTAARSIEADVFALLLSNSGNGPTMVDGKALFHADHGNIGTGSALTVAGLDADRVKMAEQKDISGNDYLDIRPSILLVPIGLESTAKVLNSSTYDPDATNKLQKPNVALGMFNDIVGSPRITGTARYMFASPSEEPVFEVVFLDGNQSPYLESQEGFRVDGMEWKVRMDYGVGAIGYKGVVKNSGVGA